MFRGFQLDLGDSDFSSYQEDGEAIFDGLKDEVKPVLDSFILTNGAIDADSMQDEWFPQKKMDIFISHAHADRDRAVALAGFLAYELNITSFIDSCIWGHAKNLLWRLDKKYCKDDDDEFFDYHRRNHSTAHVHMILNNALSQMIDNCECFFFLKTENSTVESIIKDKTNSPWIFSEISTSRMIEKKDPPRPILNEMTMLFSKGEDISERKRADLKMEFRLKLQHLMPLNTRDLLRWKEHINSLHEPRERHPLDKLYKLKPITR